MGRESVQARHEESFRLFLDCWLSAERRAALEIGKEEAGYSTLEHAGLCVRLQPGGQLPVELEQMSLPDRVALVHTACGYAAEFSLPKHFSRFLKEDLPEPEEIEEIEHVLSQIDGLDAVVDLAVRLVDPTLETDRDLLAELARTRCIVAELLRQLLVREDLAAVASRFVLVQREPRYLEDGRPADWFTRLRELDRGFKDRSLGELVRSPVVFYPLLEPVLSEHDAQAFPMGMAAAGTNDRPTSKAQAELSRREFVVEGDEAILVRLKTVLPPVRSRPALEVLLEHKEANGQNGISAYKEFEVFVPGLSAPLRNRFDFDVNTVELDEQAWEALRASGGQVAVVLVTTSGQRRSIHPK
jgi:hypothetical protein